MGKAEASLGLVELLQRRAGVVKQRIRRGGISRAGQHQRREVTPLQGNLLANHRVDRSQRVRPVGTDVKRLEQPSQRLGVPRGGSFELVVDGADALARRDVNLAEERMQHRGLRHVPAASTLPRTGHLSRRVAYRVEPLHDNSVRLCRRESRPDQQKPPASLNDVRDRPGGFRGDFPFAELHRPLAREDVRRILGPLVSGQRPHERRRHLNL